MNTSEASDSWQRLVRIFESCSQAYHATIKLLQVWFLYNWGFVTIIYSIQYDTIQTYFICPKTAFENKCTIKIKAMYKW